MRDPVLDYRTYRKPSQPTPHWSEPSKPRGFPGERESDRPAPVCSRPPDGRFSARGFETRAHRGGSNFPPAAWKYPRPCPPIGVQLRVAKSNYHQVRRQKELSRKTRQQEKQQKRLAAKSGEPLVDGTAPDLSSGSLASDSVATPPSVDSAVSAPVGGTSA